MRTADHRHTPKRTFNMPLLAGTIIVALIAVIAIIGKHVAPRDPQATTFILEDHSGVWTKPPFPAFTVPGYWLGSDLQGRDLLSQLLWAVQPTMSMVVAVAFVRLILGAIIGLVSGWVVGRVGRWLDGLISASLAIPVLIVALAAMTVIGLESGLLAFIVGLSINGWAETARIAREQTRNIRTQLYVEASRALGQPDQRIVVIHVLRQIAPLLTVLLSFEISGTLLTVATLGFLGYYLGGGVWFQVGDWAMRRIAGVPELGQMLAIAAETPSRPEAMIGAGTMVLLTVLGFNLLGEGLRQQINVEAINRRETWLDRMAMWVEQNLLLPLADWMGGIAIGLTAVAMIAVWVYTRPPAPPSVTSQPITVDSNQPLWATERLNPEGTLTIHAEGPHEPQLLWQFKSGGAINAGPAVASDGTIFITSDQSLIAIDPNGNELWRETLSSEAVGVPALGANGQLYVAQVSGALSAYEPDGDLLWLFTPPTGAASIAGPIVTADDLIVYPVEGSLRAISPQGEYRWRADLPFSYTSPLPRLDGNGEHVIFEDMLFDAQTGEMVVDSSFDPLDRFIVGAGGKTYLQAANAVTEWKQETSRETPDVQWNFSGFAFGFPGDSGITEGGFIWFFYNSPFQDSRIVWADLKGELLGTVIFPLRGSRIIGVDAKTTMYICGPRRGGKPECLAYAFGQDEPIWRLTLTDAVEPNGGALLPGRLYVTTHNGLLYAIGQ